MTIGHSYHSISARNRIIQIGTECIGAAQEPNFSLLPQGTIHLSIGNERMVGIALSDSAPGSAREYLLWQLRVASSWQGSEGSAYRKYLEEALSHANDDGSGGP